MSLGAALLAITLPRMAKSLKPFRTGMESLLPVCCFYVNEGGPAQERPTSELWASVRRIIVDRSPQLECRNHDKMLAEYRNDLLPHDVALKKIWGSDTYFNGRSMDVYIAKLRKYLKEDPTIEIVNIHGNGFRLVAP